MVRLVGAYAYKRLHPQAVIEWRSEGQILPAALANRVTDRLHYITTNTLYYYTVMDRQTITSQQIYSSYYTVMDTQSHHNKQEAFTSNVCGVRQDFTILLFGLPCIAQSMSSWSCWPSTSLKICANECSWVISPFWFLMQLKEKGRNLVFNAHLTRTIISGWYRETERERERRKTTTKLTKNILLSKLFQFSPTICLLLESNKNNNKQKTNKSK